MNDKQARRSIMRVHDERRMVFSSIDRMAKLAKQQLHIAHLSASGEEQLREFYFSVRPR